jgi:hypothetical protein
MTRDEKIALVETALEQANADGDWHKVAEAIVLAIDDGPTDEAVGGDPAKAPPMMGEGS